MAAAGAPACSVALANVVVFRGGRLERDDVVAAFARAYLLAQQAGDDVARNWCLTWLGILAIHAGELDVAEVHLQEVVRSSLTSGNLHPVGEAAGRLARIAFARGDIVGGRRLLDRSVAVCRETADSRQLANQLRHRAFHHARASGQLSQAVLDLAECADLDLRVDEAQSVVETLAVATILCDAIGEATSAASARRSLAIWDLTHVHTNDDYVGAVLPPEEHTHRALPTRRRHDATRGAARHRRSACSLC